MSASEDTMLWPGLGGEDADGPYLRGTACKACGHVALGARALCPQCWASDELAPVALGRTGYLYARTKIHATPNGFDAPYVVGYVDLAEGIRVFAHIEEGDQSPAIGDAVELTFAPLRRDERGVLRLGPRYRKATGTEKSP